MTDLIASEQNILLLGDFNIHVNDGNVEDSKMFRETIEGLGLQQHIIFSTHRQGNYLDLIIMETFSNLKITSCKEGPILSDHSTVEFTLSFPREDLLRKTITFRKIKDINTNRFTTELGESIEQSDDPNILAQNIEKSMEKIIGGICTRANQNSYHQK